MFSLSPPKIFIFVSHCILDSFVVGIHFSVSFTKLRVEFFLDYGALLLKKRVNENLFIRYSPVSSRRY